ncbi:hypothetical protein [uncultured Sphingomonas sp.]|uniref:hypothetical protein n=1 Tax=uncultured Sphingomonas sp. TaxID=158754 RepID=UPI0025D61B6D|nr:hypothetical protein [uncultured Sphingomonas sp.]
MAHAYSADRLADDRAANAASLANVRSGQRTAGIVGRNTFLRRGGDTRILVLRTVVTVIDSGLDRVQCDAYEVLIRLDT